MNERIKTLFIQAGGGVEEENGNLWTYCEDLDPEKFAQLENRYLIIGDRIKKTDVNVYDSSRTSEKAYFDKVEFELALNAYQDFYKMAIDYW